MEQKDRDQLTYSDKGLCLHGVALSNIISKYQTPFYLYSEEILTRNYLEFQTEAQKAGLDATICFALKANANKYVLQTLSSLGAGADIVSGGELKLALNANISSEKIVFSGVGKTDWEIELALDNDIYSFNVESIEELKLINELAAKKNKKAKIAFRLNPKVIAKTHKHISTGYKTHKFGIIEKDILEAAKEQSLWTHCELNGISVHIGSQLIDLGATCEAIDTACKLAKKLPSIKFLDVGGGLGVSYKLTEAQAPSVNEYMQKISSVIKANDCLGLKIVFEPGRRISASCGVFITSVLRNKTSEDCHFLIVDGGMNDFVRPSLYDAYHEIIPGKLGTEMIETDIVGPICETADCFGTARSLPKLVRGDFIAIADTGAYGQTMSGQYNQRPAIREFFMSCDGTIH